MKPVIFLGDSKRRLRDFPDKVRSQAGLDLFAVQSGRDPADWKPMKSVGVGVKEIRIREGWGAFRVFYLATLPDRVLVLHAFQKKTQKTPQHEIDLATQRLRVWKDQNNGS